MAKLTLEHLYDSIQRMRIGDMPASGNMPSVYANMASMAAEELPKMSEKGYERLMELVYSAYQLGQLRIQILQERQLNTICTSNDKGVSNGDQEHA